MKRSCLSLLALLIILCSCGRGNTSASDDRRGIQGDSVYVSQRYELEETDGIRKLVISDPWQNARGIELIYYLVPAGMDLPDTIDEKKVIRVPVRSMVCMSTTHLAMLRALDATSIVTGISGSDLLFDSLLHEEAKSGRIPDVGYENNLDRELVASIRPDLIMTYNIGAPSEYTRKLEDMGIRVIYNADYLEQHPLARCGWIRVFGALTGHEAMADSILKTITASYLELADSVKRINTGHPDILFGAPWEDVWYVSPANSYTGRLIEDAGGHYLFDDLIAPNSVPYSVEAVFSRAADADLWINPGTAESLAQIAAADGRLARLNVCSPGKVWNNRKRITPAGGNDYWESAVVRPDLLLKDLVSIIHPELMPGYDQLYYKCLP